MHSFEIQTPVQLSTQKPILHISINPHPEDVLTDLQLADIAREYMWKLGYGGQPYLVYKHTDIDRHHIHIVGLRVDENGRQLNDRFEHQCNPINAAFMSDIVDAYEASYTIMLNLNRSWITKQGDFFVESPIILLAAII